MDNCVHVLG